MGLARYIGSGEGGSPAILAVTDFTTGGLGIGVLGVDFVTAGVTQVDIWINEEGEQGIKVTDPYTYNALTGNVSGLQANKDYTAYGR